MELGFVNLLLVMTIAFAAPLALGLVPALRVPAVVVELVLGIVAGPAVLGWIERDEAIAVLSTLGLALLLFLAGLEIEFDALRGDVLRLAVFGFALSFALGLAVGLALAAAGLVSDAVFVAIVLTATSLGVVVPVLKDGGEAGSAFGQLVIAAATIADVATIVLLSLLFSRETTGAAAQLLAFGTLAGAIVVLALAIRGARMLGPISAVLRRLQDTTAQIRVRGAVLLLVGLVALATELGLELILGAFLAGALIGAVDRDERMTHPALRSKLDAVGFGVFIPVFFVASGLQFDLAALGDPGTLAQVPVFLAALVAVRGVPALLYRPLVSRERVAAAALLQATSLPFIVASTAIGRELGVVEASEQAALIAAGLLSVVLFPAGAVALLSGRRAVPAAVRT